MIEPTSWFLNQLIVALNTTVSAGNFTGPLVKVKCGLFVNAITLTPETTLAMLTVATFDGYALSADAVWGAPYLNADGSWSYSSSLIQFLMTGTTTPNTVYGYYVVPDPNTGSNLSWAELFTAPIPMTTTGNAINISLNFTTGYDNWGSATVIT